MQAAFDRAAAFAARHGLPMPIVMAPMAGVPSIALAAACGRAGAMAALGALLMEPPAIADWVARCRAGTVAPLLINLWIPDAPPLRDPGHEARVREFLAGFGPAVPDTAAEASLPDFAAQCEAILAARPAVASSIMGLFPATFVQRLKDAGIAWWATASSVTEAREAAAAGADVIVAQGAEAGGHRGAFVAAGARDRTVGLFALLPQVVDAVTVPVVATGGIADARGVVAALALGASAVQIGSALLRCAEAAIAPAWAHALAGLDPERTQLTRAFSGRWGRAIATRYVTSAAAPGAPEPAPYPVQRGLTQAMRKAAEGGNDVQRMQAWAGQGVALADGTGAGAEAYLRALWRGALALGSASSSWCLTGSEPASSA